MDCLVSFNYVQDTWDILGYYRDIILMRPVLIIPGHMQVCMGTPLSEYLSITGFPGYADKHNPRTLHLPMEAENSTSTFCKSLKHVT